MRANWTSPLFPLTLAFGLWASPAAGAAEAPQAAPAQRDIHSLRQAIQDLIATFAARYPKGESYLKELAALEPKLARGDPAARAQFLRLKQEALLANPLLDFGRLLVVKRKSRKLAGAAVLWAQEKTTRFPVGNGLNLGLPSNHECNASLDREGYDNEIAVLSPVRPDGKLATLWRPPDGGYVGEIDLHWDAQRLLFTRSDRENWKIWEIRTDGTGLRQVSRLPPDVDGMDPCYLPDGRIVFGSTASYQSVPCWHGQKRVSNLYVMNADGTGVRQVCFDQDHNFHPSVLENGQIVYHRWDYTGINHIFLRQLMVMNPDGTGQRAIYGSNSWFPNSLYFPRAVPGSPGRLVCILSGYHGVHRMGQLVLVDTTRGWFEADGLVQRISGRGDPIRPMIRDKLVDDDWPKFLHPFPLSDKYFLVACWPSPKSLWGIYLADVFDNLVLVREEPGWALLEPVPVVQRPRPPVVPDRVDLSQNEAVVYLHDIYSGPGLAGVPRGTIKALRVLAYHFAYRGLGGPDRIGYGGPWEVMRILGTVPLEPDGSAMFRVPAQTPIAVQALDADHCAVQLMRSWFTAQPGEMLSCVGCHERPCDAAPCTPARAARQSPRELTPWYGPARGLDFAREVQPVLDRYCTGCHDGVRAGPDLRREELVPEYRGRRISKLGISRLHPQMLADTQGILRYGPAYEALIPYIRRVGIEDDVSLLVPGEYHAHTSELVQMLRKGHQGVRLDAEAWDRLVTWIDLNAPCHGTWGEVYPIPDGAHERRMALRRAYGGPDDDPEAVPPMPRRAMVPVVPEPLPQPKAVQIPDWPLSAQQARARQAACGPPEKTVELGDGVTMKLVRVPAGEFVMGDAAGEPDERPLARVAIPACFWIGTFEVTNQQYRLFDPRHDSGYYGKRHLRGDDQGLPLSGPQQPVVRVSWDQAMAFCRWLSGKTGLEFTLPTEAQWEYACRAGSATPLAYGDLEADFSLWANVADHSFSTGLQKHGKQATGGLEHLILEGAALSDARFSDGAVVTAPVGSYRPNPWGLYDMHGNAAEWTLTTYRPYPYLEDGRSEPASGLRKVVRGGSFFDRPERCRSGFRLDYPAWQRVFNVGFRVVCNQPDLR
ncbi:MAG: SUMF1/EgtB/PvdO family nonheme iron enzyme [Thermoguttaceae bacterium]